MGLTIKAILNKTRVKNDGTYPIAVRVTYDANPIRVPTGLCVPEEFWDEEAQEVDKKYKATANVARMNKKIQKIKVDASDTMLKLEDSGELYVYTNPEIKNIILGKKPNPKKQQTVFEFMDELIKGLIKAKKEPNAAVYQTCRNFLKNYLGHEQLRFSQLDYRLLLELETSHYSKGNKAGGLRVYLATLSATFTTAIKVGLGNKDRNPFNDYKIKQGTPNRQAMSAKDFEVFRNATFAKGTAHYRSHKLYMASFYMRGANWKDMALLRVKDIDREFTRIPYVRSKTKGFFNIQITNQLREIIFEFMKEYNRYEPDDYVFPILDKSEQEEDQDKNMRYRRQNANRSYRQISKLLNIGHFSIYTARHTFATTAQRNNVPVGVIREAMGHKTEIMTQVYLDSFQNKLVDSYDEQIMA